MKTLNKWTRILHRWLVLPFVLDILVLIGDSFFQSIGFQLPGWLSGVALALLLTLLLTGLYLWVQHYAARWRQRRRINRKLAGTTGE